MASQLAGGALTGEGRELAPRAGEPGDTGPRVRRPGVELLDVHKSFGAVAAVRGVTLALEAGAVTALVGPSGCGKTTTLRLVAGFDTPDRGEVRIGGRAVAGGAGGAVPPERRRVGMVFQQLALFPHLDVAGNIAYGLSRTGRAERQARVAELLELVGLVGYERRRPHELSGGQAQRVALARALGPRPDVVLLDEPFSSLDVTLRAGVRAEVRSILQAAGATALLVTHDQEEALSLGDQVAVMLDGRIAQVGTPDEVYRRPVDLHVAGFLGAANLFEAELNDGVLHTPLGLVAVPRGGSGGVVTALVRPEDLDLLDIGPDEGETDGHGGAGAVGAVGTVTAVEYYGHDQLVVVALAEGKPVRARLHADRRLQPGTRVRVTARRAYPLP
ncbi:MAG TPA: ABC transporter ATP-binding protein [Acidimicrobiales bacterium]|nr:ABC transporter ATP-binding protein [Acidimicrobiales bacterium]